MNSIILCQMNHVALSSMRIGIADSETCSKLSRIEVNLRLRRVRNPETLFKSVRTKMSDAFDQVIAIVEECLLTHKRLNRVLKTSDTFHQVILTLKEFLLAF
ncbi:hypothetical protein Trydic_g8127 [Trypoxylus dichotomus]